MVKVREEQPLLADGKIDINACLRSFEQEPYVKYLDSMHKACQWVQNKEAKATLGSFWGEVSCLQVGLEMAQILAELKMDEDSILAALVYRTVRENKGSLDEVEQDFGEVVAKLVQSVQGMAAISQHRRPSRGHSLGEGQDQRSNIRKMLVSIIDDVRVALIKLAERTCAIRALKGQSKERCRRVAAEVFDIYAPLAHRLGIGHIKWELEDLSFRYLKSSDYKKIARLLDEKRLDRQDFINQVIVKLKSALNAANIGSEVHGRAKHIYSIWRKMRRKNADFRELYDIRAFRVLVDEIPDCYATLGIIHSLWKHIPKEFDDYIATPKENGYRSLHTAVIGENGKTMEVQIRTHAMHEEAELGVCAHWKYKGTDINSKPDSYEEKLSWLRQVMEWHEDLDDLEGLADQWRADVEPDRIYVFTTAGHVIDLPVKSTPLDFAYHIHTEIGNKCRGAKVGDRIVPLNHQLRTGDQVQILTAPSATPSRDWLNPHLGYVVTTRAKAKITRWLKTQNRESHETHGKTLLHAEFKRLDLHVKSFGALAELLNLKTEQDIYVALGAGDLRTTQVVGALQRLTELHKTEQEEIRVRPRLDDKAVSDGAIDILGVGNLLTQIANCCHPLPGDPIVGYITLGRGVSVHRKDCANVLQLQSKEPARILEVSWGSAEKTGAYPVDIVVEAYDREGLLRDITTLLADEKINVLSVATQTVKDKHTARMELTIEIFSLERLVRILGRLNQLSNIIEAYRGRRKPNSNR